MSDDLSAMELLERTGISQRQIQHWVTKGYLTPVTRQRASSGIPLRFTAAEVDIAQTMADLVRAGVTPAAAAALARYMHDGSVFRVRVTREVIIEIDRREPRA